MNVECGVLEQMRIFRSNREEVRKESGESEVTKNGGTYVEPLIWYHMSLWKVREWLGTLLEWIKQG